jgi:type I restriction enzyme S subunit
MHSQQSLKRWAMKSNYRRIGDFIELVDIRNKELKVKKLLGLSISKQFIPSVANIVGTSMRGYKIIKKNQFACSIMQVRRDRKMPVALLKDYDEAIISQAYPVFEITKPQELLPDYLMMWFTRSEFDRHAEFLAVGGVRGSLEWEDFLDMTLPVPSLEKQQELVADYNTVQGRIRINEELNTALEETAQALYKHWFVDFEFPAEYASSRESRKRLLNEKVASSPLDLHPTRATRGMHEERLGYKSSGGAMVYNEELDMEIPLGWEDGKIKDLSNQFSGYSFKGNEYSFEDGIAVVRGENVSEQFLRWDTKKKWNKSLNERMNKCFLRHLDILIGMDGSKVGKNWTLINENQLPLILAQRVTSIRATDENFSFFIFFSLMVLDFERYVGQVHTGTSVPHISGTQIENFPLIIPEMQLLEFFQDSISNLYITYFNNIKQNEELEVLKSILLSKMATVEDRKELVN